MKSIKHLKKPAVGGSLLSLALVLLALAITLNGLNTGQVLTRQISTQVKTRERLRDLSRSMGQLDLLHLRYRATGLALFQVGCDQITDSVAKQLIDLHSLIKNDPSKTKQLQLVIAGIDTVQRYWRSADDHALKINAQQTALKEEQRLDVVRSAIADFDELVRLPLKNLQQRQDSTLMQLRFWLILLEILIAVILLIVSLQSGLTRISTPGAPSHGSLHE